MFNYFNDFQNPIFQNYNIDIYLRLILHVVIIKTRVVIRIFHSREKPESNACSGDSSSFFITMWSWSHTEGVIILSSLVGFETITHV